MSYTSWKLKKCDYNLTNEEFVNIFLKAYIKTIYSHSKIKNNIDIKIRIKGIISKHLENIKIIIYELSKNA
tara:strand:- start:325 stop:537 length:213 start_codon:yes stop_codon:yes gene_type:complete